MAKLGFNGQWIEICKVGKAFDSKGTERDLTREFLEAVVANYNAGTHEAPLTIGHPKTNAPAFGWAAKLRMNGDVMELQAEDTDDQFEQLVADGRFRTRSGSFYLRHPSLPAPTLNHVAFLGAEAPAVKGLRNIQFSTFADGESFTVEETFNLQETEMKEEDLDKLPESFWEKFKAKLGYDKKTDLKEGGIPVPQPAATNFNESAMKELIAEAVTEVEKKVTADFTEKLKAKDDELKELRESVDAGTASGRRSEIVSFVESIPAGKGKYFLKNIGIVEFLESLAVADAKDKDPAIVCFSEPDKEGKKEEHRLTRLQFAKDLLSALPPMIEFGEKFGNIVATKEADAMINSDRVESMKKAAGVAPKKEGGND